MRGQQKIRLCTSKDLKVNITNDGKGNVLAGPDKQAGTQGFH